MQAIQFRLTLSSNRRNADHPEQGMPVWSKESLPISRGIRLLDYVRTDEKVKKVLPQKLSPENILYRICENCDNYSIQLTEEMARECTLFENTNDATMLIPPHFLSQHYSKIDVEPMLSSDNSYRVSVAIDVDTEKFLEEWKYLGYPTEMKRRGTPVDEK